MSNKGFNFEHTYAELPNIFYADQKPAVVPSSQMVVFNSRLSEDLGLDTDILKNTPEIFTGSTLAMSAKPIAQAYAGYQFGHFAMLGDGRALLLGEHITPQGDKFDIALKGSGLTPYSRGGDGYAALLPMLREYIISEAMYYLGVPTTRSLAVTLTGNDVVREKLLQGAVLTRVASSHIRVGTFNFASAFGCGSDLKTLADYCISRHFPWIDKYENKYLLLLREVAMRQAVLIAKWQLLGFVHGVMNTDNMAISGETIDYGPCAFMDYYDENTVFSSIDTFGRYAYKNQPTIGAWNLSRLAEALLPLFCNDEDRAIELANEEITNYWLNYKEHWINGMRARLGLVSSEPDDRTLASELLEIMSANELDYTSTFRQIALGTENSEYLNDMPGFSEWQEKWQSRLSRQPYSMQHAKEMMRKNNPSVIPRNHKVEEALAAAEYGDYTFMHNFLLALRAPYEDSEAYSLPPGPLARRYKTFCGT